MSRWSAGDVDHSDDGYQWDDETDYYRAALDRQYNDEKEFTGEDIVEEDEIDFDEDEEEDWDDDEWDEDDWNEVSDDDDEEDDEEVDSLFKQEKGWTGEVDK